MTPHQYRTAIHRLGLSQVQSAKLFRANPRTVRRWLADERAIPETVAVLLRLLVEGKITIEEIEGHGADRDGLRPD